MSLPRKYNRLVSELTPELQIEICRHLLDGCKIKQAAMIAGAQYSVVHEWLRLGRHTDQEPYRGFALAVDCARGEYQKKHLRTIAAAASDDWKAAQWLLERHDPDEWGARLPQAPSVTVNNNSLNVGNENTLKDLISRTRDERLARIKKHLGADVEIVGDE